MKTASLLLCWVIVFALALSIRFADLGERPLHADEATGARITAQLMEADYRFNPKHYHGPTLAMAGGLSATIAGSSGWKDLEIAPLRAVTAATGLALVMLPLLWRRRFGDGPALMAALLMASSPLLVYFSRMYIHEMLLALFGILTLWQASATRLRWLAGLWIGLMFATKETFAISIIAWTGSGLVLYLVETRGRPDLNKAWDACGKDLLLAATIALVVGFGFYTQGFRDWQAAADAVKTYFVYETVAGHDKPLSWYASLMMIPDLRGGFRWGETALAALALVALGFSWISKSLPRHEVLAVRFLALSALVHGVIYSLISYKTPWLMVLPWAHVALLAAFAFRHPFRNTLPANAGVAIIMLLVAGAQLSQAHRSSFRFASDSRNPYAYPASSTDLNKLESWIRDIDAAADFQSIEPILVVGADYWPLPWYLRRHQHVGYYPEPPPHIERLPLVFDLVGLEERLTESHVPIPRGLRDGLPVIAWVRNDFWDAHVRTIAPDGELEK